MKMYVWILSGDYSGGILVGVGKDEDEAREEVFKFVDSNTDPRIEASVYDDELIEKLAQSPDAVYDLPAGVGYHFHE